MSSPALVEIFLIFSDGQSFFSGVDKEGRRLLGNGGVGDDEALGIFGTSPAETEVGVDLEVFA